MSGREWYYQAGWDPARARDGIGLVMLGHTVREAMRDGMREYRFLRGGEAYKARFGAREAQLVTVGLASGPAGRALVAGARAILAAAPGSVPRRVARRVAARAGWDWAT
jgi:CelD/BcsL family acetyltransferase involved in cellulose biosynthesis